MKCHADFGCFRRHRKSGECLIAGCRWRGDEGEALAKNLKVKATRKGAAEGSAMPAVLLSVWLFILAALAVGCNQDGVTHEEKVSRNSYLVTVRHDEHYFVVYSEKYMNAGFGGLVHHPDCPCEKGAAKE